MAEGSVTIWNLIAKALENNRLVTTLDRSGRIGRQASLCILIFLACGVPAAVEAQVSTNKAVKTAEAQAAISPRPNTVKQLGVGAESYVYRYTNQERMNRGLPGLQPSEALSQLAGGHSVNMCRSGAFRHESESFPDGWQTFPGRLSHIGLSSGAENIGYQTIEKDSKQWAKQMVKGWMDSPTHRKNILDPRFRYMGVGIRPCKDKLGYATQVFSKDPGRKR